MVGGSDCDRACGLASLRCRDNAASLIGRHLNIAHLGNSMRCLPHFHNAFLVACAIGCILSESYISEIQLTLDKFLPDGPRCTSADGETRALDAPCTGCSPRVSCKVSEDPATTQGRTERCNAIATLTSDGPESPTYDTRSLDREAGPSSCRAAHNVNAKTLCALATYVARAVPMVYV